MSVLVGVSADRATNRYPFINDHGHALRARQRHADATRENADESDARRLGPRARRAWAAARRSTSSPTAITREQGVPSLALVPTRAARERANRGLGVVALHAAARSRRARHARRAHLRPRRQARRTRTRFSSSRSTRRIFASSAGASSRPSAPRSTSPTRLRLRPVVDVAHEGIERDPDDIPLGKAHRDFARVARRRGGAVTRRAHGCMPSRSGECHHTGASAGRRLRRPRARRAASASRSGAARLRALGNVGRYVRVPTLGEVYGVSGTVHGNPALAPETGYTGELGVRAQTGRGATLLDGAYVDAFVFGRWAERAHRLRADRTGLRHAVQRRERARARGRAARGRRPRVDSPRSKSPARSLDPARHVGRPHDGQRRPPVPLAPHRRAAPSRRLEAQEPRRRERRRGRGPRASTSRAATSTPRASASSARRRRSTSRHTSPSSTASSRLRGRVADLFDAAAPTSSAIRCPAGASTSAWRQRGESSVDVAWRLSSCACVARGVQRGPSARARRAASFDASGRRRERATAPDVAARAASSSSRATTSRPTSPSRRSTGRRSRARSSRAARRSPASRWRSRVTSTCPLVPPASGRLLLIDRYGTNVLTWMNLADATVLAQLPVGTGLRVEPARLRRGRRDARLRQPLRDEPEPRAAALRSRGRRSHRRHEDARHHRANRHARREPGAPAVPRPDDLDRRRGRPDARALVGRLLAGRRRALRRRLALVARDRLDGERDRASSPAGAWPSRLPESSRRSRARARRT